MSRGDPPESPFDSIARVLVPYLGEAMARAAIEVNRRKLGLAGERLSPQEADDLVKLLTPGLRVFVGQEQTDRIVDEIRGALGGARGGER